jgi:hypothetical protein
MNPFLKNLSIGLGGAAVTVAIYFTAITGASYPSALLNHLEDIIQGSQTRAVVSLNAPNWGEGIPLATPQVSTIATSSNPTAASGLASSTPYTFAVAALDGEGTTTLSSPVTITTDASNTQTLPENVNLTWPAVTGAQGYAIFFATSSTATTFSQYFLATSTSGVPNSQYTFATSTNSIAGSYTRNTSTAFSLRLLPGSNSFINTGSVGVGTSTPASSTPMDVNGYMRASRPATSTACEADTAGVMFYNAANQHEWGCNGTAWTKIY